MCIRDRYRKIREKSLAMQEEYTALQRAFLDGQAGILAETLKEGKPCPVCGSLHLSLIHIWEPEEKRDHILYLYPRICSVGIGCRRGVGKEKIEEVICQVFRIYGWRISQIFALASIDRKADEEGILAFVKKHGLTFLTYTAEELNMVEEEVSASDFVKKTTGTDNVCERAALLAGGGAVSYTHLDVYKRQMIALESSLRIRCLDG